MSTRLAEAINSCAQGATNTPQALALPSAAANKAAGQGAFFAVFVRIPKNGFKENVTRNILLRANGGTGGADAYLRLNQAGTTLSYAHRQGGTVRTSVASLTTLVPGRSYLVGVALTQGFVHLFACEAKPTAVAADVLVASEANTYMAATAMTGTGAPFVAVGDNPAARSNTSRSYYGRLDNLFMVLGNFPEPTTGVPDKTLLAAIAAGTQAISGLAALMGSGAIAFHYPLSSPDDLTDALGGKGPLTTDGVDTTDRRLLYAGPLRPGPLMPDVSLDMASQVTFTRRGDPTSAFADVAIEGGGLASGFAPARIRAQLEKEDGTVHRAWTTIDAAPGSGRWVKGVLPSVLMTSGWLRCRLRAEASDGTVLWETFTTGLKGPGFNPLTQHQSQGTFLFETYGGIALPTRSRTRLMMVKSSDTEVVTQPGPYDNLPAPASFMARGVRQMALEIDALFPGVPISIATIGEQGTDLADWLPTTGAYADRAGRYAALQGNAPQPYALLMMQHSQGVSSAYPTTLAAVMDDIAAKIGRAPVVELHASVTRYRGIGATGTPATQQSRSYARDVVASRGGFWGTNGATVKTDNEASSSPHPSGDDDGEGRSGAYWAWALMSAVGAVRWRPPGLSEAKRQTATRIRLGFAPVNA